MGKEGIISKSKLKRINRQWDRHEFDKNNDDGEAHLVFGVDPMDVAEAIPSPEERIESEINSRSRRSRVESYRTHDLTKDGSKIVLGHAEKLKRRPDSHSDRSLQLGQEVDRRYLRDAARSKEGAVIYKIRASGELAIEPKPKPRPGIKKTAHIQEGLGIHHQDDLTSTFAHEFEPHDSTARTGSVIIGEEFHDVPLDLNTLPEGTADNGFIGRLSRRTLKKLSRADRFGNKG